MSVSPIPDGFHTITPNIVVDGVENAIEFYKKAFGAEEKVRLTMPDGKIAHCELAIGDSRLNIGEAMEGWPPHPLLAQIHVQDADAVFSRAVNAGAKVVMPMCDMFFGSREGRVADPFGGTWTIATRTEIVSTEEMQRRLDTWAAGT
jgi:PhnB protein